MTHKTGPRRQVVLWLCHDIMSAQTENGATATEALAAMQQYTMRLMKAALAPYEDETCPTCPKGRKRKARV